MSGHKRVKHTASGRPYVPKKPLKRGSGSRSAQANENEYMEEDPYYTAVAQVDRMSHFASRKPMALRYCNTAWLKSEGFMFPFLLDTQKVTNFLDLKGKIYTNLVKEFYANFLLRDDTFMTMVSGVRIILDNELFINVAGLSSDGIGLQDCHDPQWETFDIIDFYKSCMRHENLYVAGSLKKAGLFTVENRLLHYVLVYLLVPRKSNHAQPSDLDLTYMFAIKNGILLNWQRIILAQMSNMAKLNSTKPLGYGILISRIIDHLGIDTTGQVVQPISESKHLVGESLLHQMQIYKHGQQWVHQNNADEDIDFAADINMGQEENLGQEGEQPAHDADIPQAENENVPDFGIAHLDAMEQRLNARIDQRFQTLTDSISTRMEDGFRAQGEAIQAQFDHISFLMRTLGGFQQPPNP